MALDGTYNGLQASIAGWLTRSDLAALIPDFITLAEARLNERLRLAPMETQTRVSTSISVISSGGVLIDPGTGAILTDPDTGAILTATGNDSLTVSTAPLPTDFLEMRSITANTTPERILRLATPDWARNSYSGLSGYPDVYTIIGSQLVEYPETDATLDMIY